MMRTPVLMYHRVGPVVSGPHPELTVSPGQFSAEMRLLRRLGYAGIGAGQWLAGYRGSWAPRRPVVITFDDAYADLETFAFPVLRACGYGCTVFAATALLGGVTPWDGHPVMTAAAVTRWAASGIEFGAHTHTHPDLTVLPPQGVAEELDTSAAQLEVLTGERPVALAYPSGRYNAGVMSAAADRFALAYTSAPGLNTPATSPHELRRHMVFPGDTLLDIVGAVTVGSGLVRRLRARFARQRTR
jgi:peptidoglycan/xylan/chitin deacetylase (PgdA/CDA1 family)